MQQTQPDRMRALVEAGIALSSELSLHAVLQKLVERWFQPSIAIGFSRH